MKSFNDGVWPGGEEAGGRSLGGTDTEGDRLFMDTIGMLYGLTGCHPFGLEMHGDPEDLVSLFTATIWPPPGGSSTLRSL